MATIRNVESNDLFSVLAYNLWWSRFTANYSYKQRRNMQYDFDCYTDELMQAGWQLYLYNNSSGSRYWFVIAPNYIKSILTKEITLHNLKYSQDYVSLKFDLHKYLLETNNLS